MVLPILSKILLPSSWKLLVSGQEAQQKPRSMGGVPYICIHISYIYISMYLSIYLSVPAIPLLGSPFESLQLVLKLPVQASAGQAAEPTTHGSPVPAASCSGARTGGLDVSGLGTYII